MGIWRINVEVTIQGIFGMYFEYVEVNMYFYSYASIVTDETI